MFSIFRQTISPKLLESVTISNLFQSSVLARGMKYVLRPKLRCDGCYFEVKNDQKFVFCTKHPRHKQGTFTSPVKHQYIMTHATQGSGRARRPGNGRRQMMTQHAFRLDF